MAVWGNSCVELRAMHELVWKWGSKQRTEWDWSSECLVERAHTPNQEINFSHLNCKPRKQCREVLLGTGASQVQSDRCICAMPFAAHLISRHSLCHPQGTIWGERWARSRWTDATSGWVWSTSVSVAWKLPGLAVQWGSIDKPGKEGGRRKLSRCWHEGPDHQMRAASSCLWYRLEQLTSISYFKISLNLHFMCASSQL